MPVDPTAVPPAPVPPSPSAVREGWWRRLARGGSWWWMPLLLSALFTLAVAVWLQRSDQRDLEEGQRQLISDSLSLERQISARVSEEQLRLDSLARGFDLEAAGGGGASLARVPGVRQGLQRLWQSVAWVDERTRLRAVWPEQADLGERPGLSAHLSAPLRDAQARPAGALVVRYAPAALLRQSVPWWLSREYEVRLVDAFGQMIGSFDSPSPQPGQESHRVSLEPALPGVWLELSTRHLHRPWWRSLPVVLMGGFMVLIALTSLLLRRQVREVVRTGDALRTEAAWRQAMEDSLTVGLRARDFDGRLVYVNRTFCDLVGYPQEVLVGLAPPFPYWPPDQIAESMSRHLRNLAGRAPREGYEARWRRADGRMVDVMVFEAPLVDARGRQIGWMGSILDITERKRLEERERRQTDAMAHQGRLTMLGEVASALAHQLNQPLTSITSYAAGVRRLLERGADAGGAGADPRVLGAMTRLGEQAAEAGRIVKRIREFLTRRTPQRETVALADVARRALGLMARDLQRQHVLLETVLDLPLPSVVADPVLVEQVVLNLVHNACDEMQAQPEAGRRLRVALSAAGPGFVRLDVEDSGPGLRGRRIEELVEPFYSTKPEGMGMGLAICRSIIEAHHGAFDAGASLLGGAAFSFTLPVAGGQGDDGEDQDR